MVGEKLTIAYFANPDSVHDSKWINHFAKKYKVVVLCGKKKKNKPYVWLNKEIKSYPILPVFSALNFIKTNKVKKQLQLILKQEKITVLHSMYAVPNAIWAEMVADGNHIITTRGSDVLVDYLVTYQNPKGLRQKISYALMRRYIERAMQNAKLITSTSLRQKNAIEALVSEKAKLHVIRTGVDVDKFKSLASVKESSKELVIFSPRSMKPIYNIDLLIEGVAQYIETNKDVSQKIVLKIINDIPTHPYAQYILDLIDQKGFDFVKVLPRMKQEEMLEEYRASDIVIMIPKSDGTPVSAIETMFLKKPLILGALAYDEDLFNKDSIWKIRDFSAKAISNTISDIIANPILVKSKNKNSYSLAMDKASLHKSLEVVNGLYEKITNS